MIKRERYQKRLGGKYSIRRKLLPVIRYSWEKMPEIDINVYHAKTHLSEANLHRLALLDGVKLTGKLEKCVDCIHGKIKRPHIRLISTYKRARKFGGRFFMDYSGPVRIKGFRGVRYIVCIIDDCSRKKFCYLTKNRRKETTRRVLEQFYTQEVIPRGAKIEILRTDSDKTFVNEEVIDFLCSIGATREYTSDYTPQQNGVVESAIRDTKKLAITLLNAANLSSQHQFLWSEAFKTATLLLNDCPHRANAYKSPNSVLKEKGIPLAKRYQFGSHALVVDEHPLLMQSKVHECLFVGYSENKPAESLRFFKISTGEIIDSSNYQVVDGMMLFTKKKMIFNDILTIDDNLEHSAHNKDKESISFPYIKSLMKNNETSSFTEEDDDNFLDDDTPDEDLEFIGSWYDKNESGLHSDDNINDNNQTDNSGQGHENNDETIDDTSTESSSSTSDRTTGSDDDTICLLSEEDSDNDDNESEKYVRRSVRLSNKAAIDYRKSNRDFRVDKSMSYFVQVFFCSDGTIRIPKSYKDAVTSPQFKEWLEAIRREYACLMKNKTWDVVVKPDGVPVIGCRWVFNIKMNPDGSIKRYKARLVAQGFSQTYGVDYFDTFAPVVSINSVRLLLALATIHDWDTRQLDIETAYLNADVKEDIYMRCIPGYHIPANCVLKLNKSLYGLKQAGKNWHDHVSQFLLDIGMTRSSIDPCLFLFHRSDGKIALLSIYVDDILITGDATETISEIVDKLKLEYNVQDLGDVYHLLGMIVERDRIKKTTKIHQASYIRKMLGDFDISDVHSSRLPVPSSMYSDIAEAAFNDDRRTSNFDYPAAIGCLIHLSNTTRPDISNAVRALSAYTSNYTDIHIKFIKRVLKYLEGTAELGLFYAANGGDELSASASTFSKENFMELLNGFSDSSWADNYHDGTSNSGICILLGLCLIVWKANKQRLIAKSTMEAEYVAMAACIENIQDIRHLLSEVVDAPILKATTLDNAGDNAIQNVVKATKIYGDNIASITVGNSNFNTRRSRNINVKFHIVKDSVREGVVSLHYTPSKENKADFFTKCLGGPTFMYLRSMFMA